jgi:hypothetical protein
MNSDINDIAVDAVTEALGAATAGEPITRVVERIVGALHQRGLDVVVTAAPVVAPVVSTDSRPSSEASSTRLSFGKLMGMSVADAVHTDRPYCEWMVAAVEFTNKRLRELLVAELQRTAEWA